MTGGHNVFTSDGSIDLVEGGADTTVTTTTKKKLNGRLEPVTNVVEYTTGGQIGAPSAQGCCGTPPDAKCVGGTCVGGTNNGGACTNGGDCPSDNGRSSDCPWGEWQHTHHEGVVTWTNPDGSSGIFGETLGDANNEKAASFDFHSGTASAPQAAFIENIMCGDPGWCVQARCAPDKQIFWEGIGVFKSASNIDPDEEFAACVTPGTKGNKTPSLHYYRAHVGDFGEPAGNKQKPASFESCGWSNEPGVSISNCALNGVELLPGVSCTSDGDCGHHGTCQADVCTADDPFGSEGGQICAECADWYEIEIHCTTDPNSPIIYKVGNFIREGNFQIHPEVGSNCQDTFGIAQ
jgi:hypothetical protein